MSTSHPDDIDMLDLPTAAAELGLPVTGLSSLVNDGRLVVLRGADGVRRVPAAFILNGEIVKGLPGVITLLRDARFSDDELVEWLFRADDSLGGTPIEQLRLDRGTEIKRRAQAAGF